MVFRNSTRVLAHSCLYVFMQTKFKVLVTKDFITKIQFSCIYIYICYADFDLCYAIQNYFYNMMKIRPNCKIKSLENSKFQVLMASTYELDLPSEWMYYSQPTDFLRFRIPYKVFETWIVEPKPIHQVL